MGLLRTEMHCHNVFSNFNVGEEDAPYDCNVTISDQLTQSLNVGLNTLFVTNHNTLKGFSTLLDYKLNHEKFKKLRVFPAEEVTTDRGGHILVYGINKSIRPGLSVEEIIDEARKQDAVTSAAHPFSVMNYLREKSKLCDLVEVFNSNNVDQFSNIKATEYAIKNNMVGVAGSDSHVNSTIGRCVNVIESENNLDDILFAMKHKKISIQNQSYISEPEQIEHLRYKIINSKEFLYDYINKNYPHSKWLCSLLLKLFNYKQDSYLWHVLYKIAILLLKRVSKKINLHNQNPDIFDDRDLKKMMLYAI